MFHVGDVLRKLRERADLTLEEVAEKTGMGKGTISQIERGEGNPRQSTLDALAKFYSLKGAAQLFAMLDRESRGELTIDRAEADVIDEDVASGYMPGDVPVIAEGDATPEPNLFWNDEGLRSDVEDRISRPFDVRDPRAYGVRVRGDSMVPRYKPGDTLVVSPNAPVDDGDEAYVALLSGERLLKIARKSRDGWILESYNPAYAARFVGREEVGTIHRILWIRPKRRSRESSR